MKTFATKEKRSAPAARKSHSYVHHPMGPVQQAQQAEIRRILRSTGAQAKLTIVQPNDKYEQEADRVADQVMRMPEPKLQRQSENEEEEEETVQAKFKDGKMIQRMCPECKKEQSLQRQPEEEEEETLQTKATRGHTPTVGATTHAKIQSLTEGGQPLSPNQLTFFGSRMGYDFSGVRIHAGTQAADTAQALQAKAFTLRNNIVFNTGQYSPNNQEGNKLLAHELTHVVQQDGRGGVRHDRAPTSYSSISIMRKNGVGSTSLSKPKINYKRAKRKNKYFAKKNVLGWGRKLSEVASGAYKNWETLWKGRNYNKFADAVAAYQVMQGLTGKKVDGVLGLKTWARIAGIGEAIAGIRKVRWEDSENVCTTATAERIRRGYKLATGKSLELSEDKTMSDYNAILQSSTGRMLDVDLRYRGAGAAGALAYAGLGELLSETDIWDGKLKPGAAVQVWGNKKAYRLLRAGEIGKGKNKRRINNMDANFYGTSFVFVRYDSKTNKRMLVRHYGSTQWKSKGSFAVWVAANLKSP